MIPGSDMRMEELLMYHTHKQLRTSYEEIFKKASVIKKMKEMGLSINPTLSNLEKHFHVIDELRKEFAGKYEFARDKIECTKNKILDYQHYYDRKLSHKILGVIQNDLPVTDDDIKWPPSYVSYHCKQEGFDARLSSLHIVILYQLGFAENIILRNLEPFLKELAKGVAIVNFIDELNKQLPPNTVKLNVSKKDDKKQLSHPAIGILHAYLSNNNEGEPITNDTKDDIARIYGWMNKNSGHSIYQQYLKFSLPSSRTNSYGLKADTLKLKYFDEVITYLNEQDSCKKSCTQAEQEARKFNDSFYKNYPDKR